MKRIIKQMWIAVQNMVCPRCGGNMTKGVSHTGAGSQWECHNCGKIINC